MPVDAIVEFNKIDGTVNNETSHGYWCDTQDCVVTIFHYRPKTASVHKGDVHYVEQTEVCFSSDLPEFCSEEGKRGSALPCEEWQVLDIPFHSLKELHMASKKIGGVLDLKPTGQSKIRDNFSGQSSQLPLTAYFQRNSFDIYPKTWVPRIFNFCFGLNLR